MPSPLPEVGSESVPNPRLQATAGTHSPGLTGLLPQMQWFLTNPVGFILGGGCFSEVKPREGQAAQQGH